MVRVPQYPLTLACSSAFPHLNRELDGLADCWLVADEKIGNTDEALGDDVHACMIT